METPLQNLLSRYKNLIPASRAVKEAVVKTVGEECDLALESNQVDVRSSIVYLRVSPSARSLIFRKKNTLLERINGDIDVTIQDIR